ncbi:transglycosylase domain-containing protein [Thermoflavimicrobium dichotomicum]|uniref:Penicillin-binding protein n=1 Tax=Thermoflavimicrobium dichotomicum TaxID=46223 RepID=A0A1I3MLE6_9BACL|nr:transglycosylase domain-containing protein [Thermoflavimicrobium dichotomicum]SFI97545.1 penicillin-binding protein [Thermoflavimicrobium dichotomicum]
MEKENENEKEKKKEKKTSITRNIFRWFFRTVFVLFVLILITAVGVVGVGLGYISAYAKDEKLRTRADYDKYLTNWSETSYAYFRPNKDGTPELIGRFHNDQDRQLIKDLREVSPYLIDAFIATEDREFYRHPGVAPRSVARAFYEQVQKAMGHETQTTGGSTITQQLVRTEILGERNKTGERKIREMVNAIRLEKFYSKDEIFIKYLNSAYFGQGANRKHLYGVVAAARGIFNKDIKDLALAQAAYIAGMVQRPIAYTPFPSQASQKEENLKRGIERMKIVLHNMLVTKKITQQQYEQALRFDIKGSLAKPEDLKNEDAFTTYPFLITAIEDEATTILQELYKDDPDLKGKKRDYFRRKVKSGGYKIYTTVDKNLYDAMNKAADTLYMPSTWYKGKEIREQIGATLIDNKTGDILSFVSGVKMNEENEEHAFIARNQTGSTMKPILAYGPAMNEGILSPDSVIIDEPVRKEWSSEYYQNADQKFHGRVTTAKALQWSYNIPAIKVFRKLGKEQAFKYLRMMGMEPHKLDGESLALGGATEGFTVTEMTGAYAMIANNGQFNKPHLIDRIEDSSGKVIYDFHQKYQPKQVFKPEVAYAMTQMLRTVVTSGTASGWIGGSTGGYNVAGKTGTTNDNTDLWFIGYTPEISLGVWAGYEFNLPGSTTLANQAWVRLFHAATQTAPELIQRGTSFSNPGGSVPYKCFECHRSAPPSSDEKPAQGAPNENEVLD